MDCRNLTRLVCAMMSLGSACSAEDNPTGAVASATGTVAADAASGATPSSASPSARGTLGDPTVRTRLRNLAQQASAGAGVPTPSTMLAVASPDHQAAETIVNGAVVNDHAPVYVVMMTGGPFTAQGAPPGVPLPQGDVMTLTVDAATFRVTDVGISNNRPDLTKIGPVVVDLSVQ